MTGNLVCDGRFAFGFESCGVEHLLAFTGSTFVEKVRFVRWRVHIAFSNYVLRTALLFVEARVEICVPDV